MQLPCVCVADCNVGAMEGHKSREGRLRQFNCPSTVPKKYTTQHSRKIREQLFDGLS